MWLESTYIVSDTLTCFPLAAWCVNNGHNNPNNTLQIECCFPCNRSLKIFSLRYSFISTQISPVMLFFGLLPRVIHGYKIHVQGRLMS